MSALTTYLQPILANDGTVASQCSNRVFAFDIRKSGPNAYGPTSAIPVVSDVGYQLCTICIDHLRSFPPALSPLGATQDLIAVWIFDEWNAAGRSRMDLLAARIRVLLHRYQEPTTRALLTWSGELAAQPDPPPGTAALAQVTFDAMYVPAGIRT